MPAVGVIAAVGPWTSPVHLRIPSGVSTPHDDSRMELVLSCANRGLMRRSDGGRLDLEPSPILDRAVSRRRYALAALAIA